MDTRFSIYHRGGKRLLDVLAGTVALIALSPLLCLIAVLVRIALGAPVLFRQTRVGLHEKRFTILKFRSMTDKRTAAGELLSDTERMTRLGRFLRATSLDELPELFNVLWGDMSLVGPRPLLTRYQPWYRANELKRFDVRPGITGWAQINGRNSLNWDERFQRDVRYVENCNLVLDLKILVFTVGKVLRRENVQVDTSLTLPSLDDERREKLGGLGSQEKELKMSVDTAPNAASGSLVIIDRQPLFNKGIRCQ
jgi:lipopolysaccharide/colanic/teichoic acid biosynthesis glycosyltransferase